MRHLILDEYRLITMGVKDKNLCRVVLQQLNVDLESDEVIARYEVLVYLTGLEREETINLERYDLNLILQGLGLIVGAEQR